MLVRLLKKVCRRAALLAGTIESHAGAGYGLRFDGRMAYDLCKDQRGPVIRQVAVPDRGDHRRISRASLRNGREAGPMSRGFRHLHLHHAVMCAVPSAARRQIRIGDSRKGKHRRDQRKAEEEKQCDADKTSHKRIIAKRAIGRS